MEMERAACRNFWAGCPDPDPPPAENYRSIHPAGTFFVFHRHLPFARTAISKDNIELPTNRGPPH